MSYWDNEVWSEARNALSRWHREFGALRCEHKELLRRPGVSGRATSA